MEKVISAYHKYLGISVAILCYLFIFVFGTVTTVHAHGDCITEKSETKDCSTEEKPYLTKEFTLKGPGILKANTVAGNIEVKSVEETNKVRIELYLDRGYSFWSNNKNLDNYRINIIQRGNEIVASVERKSKETGFFSDHMRFSYKIYVPKSVSTELKTSEGNVSISGLHGHHIIKSSAGNIDVDDIKGKVKAYTAGGSININYSKGILYGMTTGGNIKVNQSQGEIRLQSSGGQIIAERISGTLLAKLGGGDIKAHFLCVSEGISLDTGAGNIYLELPRMEGYDLILKGTEISLPSNIQFEGYKSRQRVEGTVDNGGAPINLITNYGNIVLKINR